MTIRTRLLIIIAVVSVLASVLVAFSSYRFAVSNTMSEAKEKGNMVFSFMESSRRHFRDKQRPIVLDIVDKDRFYPELMSGFAVTRGIWDEFEKEVPGYRFRQATLDPLYPPNKADGDEIKIIKYFEDNKDLATTEGTLVKDGEPTYYFARPIKVGKNCLRCHGDPQDAPKDQLEVYGTENGYNWTEGETVATFITYVPISKAMDKAKRDAAMLFLFGIVGIVVLMILLWLIFNVYVVKPITSLEKRTTEMSLGKNLEEKIFYPGNDEISALAKAIERMRVSTVKLLKRFER